MKILSSLLLAMGLLLLASCGDKNTSTGAASNTTGATVGDGSLAKVKKAGVLKWGADPSGGAPYVFTDIDKPENNIGFEVDMMEKIAAYMGVKYELVKGDWPALPTSLKDTRIDILLNGYEINEVRKKSVLFSTPYFVYEQQLTVRAEDKDKYKTLEDLKGKKIGVLSGTEAANVLKAAGFSEDQIVTHDDSSTPYTSLEQGRVDAVVQENIIAAHYANSTKKPNLFNQPKTFAPGQYAAAVRLKDKTLLAEIDRILDLMKKNGELAAIYRKWNIMSDRQKEVGVEEKK